MRAWLVVVTLLALASGIAIGEGLSAQRATGVNPTQAVVSSSDGTVSRQGTIEGAPSDEQLEQRSAERFQVFFTRKDQVQERASRTTDRQFEVMVGAEPPGP